MSWQDLEADLLQRSKDKVCMAALADSIRCESDEETESSGKSQKSSPYFEGSMVHEGRRGDYQMPVSAPWWAKVLPVHTAHLLPVTGLQQFPPSAPMRLVSGCTASFAEAAVLKANDS